MCEREGLSLQAGMHFKPHKPYSILLMSLRPGAPYADQVEAGGAVLIYEGHDVARSAAYPDPKAVDQPLKYPSGKPTQNGRFFKAAQEACTGQTPPEIVKVYEKIKPGIWSYNGMFHLTDAWLARDHQRVVCKFKLVAIEADEALGEIGKNDLPVRRLIPSSVKQEVWKRDGGKCVLCQSSDNLHFDHIVPFSKGGTSVAAKNIQLLCARHNLNKGNQII